MVSTSFAANTTKAEADAGAANVNLLTLVKTKQANPAIKTKQVYVVTDIHFNPFVKCKGSSTRSLIYKLLNAEAYNWPKIFNECKMRKQTYGHDSNWLNFKSSLSFMQKLNKQHPASFVLELGDDLAHHYQRNFKKYDSKQADYRLFVAKTMQFIALELQHAFGYQVAIYPVVGNNDSDRGDYFIKPNGSFFENMMLAWMPDVNSEDENSFKNNFPHIGSYVVKPFSATAKQNPKNQNDEIIVLNSDVFSPKAKGESAQAIEDAGIKEMNWLGKQLKQAKEQGDKVWLAMHVPNSIDAFVAQKQEPGRTLTYWKQNFSDYFLKLLADYRQTVTGIFASHMHMDTFFLLHNKHQPVGFETITPAISPIFGNNPGFKIYQFNNDFQPTNYQTYYTNLTSPEPKWQEEYNFRKTYKINSAKTATLYQAYQVLYNKLYPPADNAEANNFIKFYAVSSGSQPIAHGKWLPFYYCAINQSSTKSFHRCTEKLSKK
jgi:hypothetical protein